MSVQSVEEVKANLKSHQEIFNIVNSINLGIASNDYWFNYLNDPNTFLEKSSSEIMEIFTCNFLRYFDTIFNDNLDIENLVATILHIQKNSSYTDRRKATTFFENIEDIIKAKEKLTSNQDPPDDF